MKYIKLNTLFAASIFGLILESIEIYMETCGVWLQEGLLLISIAVLSQILPRRVISFEIPAIIIFLFYIYEAYEQFAQNEICSAGAYELNPLLIALLILVVFSLGRKK